MQPGAPTACATEVPLVVDLDGTLVRTDLLWESLARLLGQRPLMLWAVPFWWLRGRAHLKRRLAAEVRVDANTLPYNEEFLDWLKAQKRAGRRIILATASDSEMAAPVAQHVGVFSQVLASDGKTNLRDTAKRKVLTEQLGERGFDYAGNSAADLTVWEGAREAIAVNASAAVTAGITARTKLGRVFRPPSSPVKGFLRALRPHQWIKNLIVFVPAVAAHRLADPAVLWPAAQAFAAFCLCASVGYLLNDLVDLEADRHHVVKRRRPFAAGELPLSAGFIAAPLLLLTALGLTLALPAALTLVLAAYFISTLCYSWQLKQVPLLDVFVLAALYTLRLVAGHVATGVAWSAWLLIFSMFIFLSLALLKRFQELRALRQHPHQPQVKGRGYTAVDLELVTMLGVASGFMAVLVLALYVNSGQVLKLYARPALLLLACPLLLYWVSRVWFLAHRGQLREDPTAFVAKDWVSYAVGGAALLAMWLATGQ